MDTAHESIEVYWPVDSEEYALRTDELFLHRHAHVAELIGANLSLPSLLRRAADGKSEPVSTDEYRQAIEEVSAKGTLDSIADAFQPVRDLLDGPTPLLNREQYLHLKKSRAQVMSSVAVVAARTEWSLYAVAGSRREALRWVMVDPERDGVIVDLDEITRQIRNVLHPGAPSFFVNDKVAIRVSHDLSVIARHSLELLPRRKRRALAELEVVSSEYLKQAVASGDTDRITVVSLIRGLLQRSRSEPGIDFDRLAEWWLDTIKPLWFQHLTRRRRTRPVLIRDLRRALIENPIDTQTLRTVQAVDVMEEPLDERVVAAIIGVKDPSGLSTFAQSAVPALTGS
jgi:hypothetical protein